MSHIKESLLFLHEDAVKIANDIDEMDSMSEQDIAFALGLIGKIKSELVEAKTNLEHIPFDEEEMERAFFPNQVEATVDA